MDGRMERLGELLAWMLKNRVLSASVDGMSITLPCVDEPSDDSAIDNEPEFEYNHPYRRPDFGAPRLTASAPQPLQVPRRGKSDE